VNSDVFSASAAAKSLPADDDDDDSPLTAQYLPSADEMPERTVLKRGVRFDMASG
jgi:hypothetical protein